MRKQDRAIRQRAKKRGESPNRSVVDELAAAAIGRPNRADFTDLVGPWTPDPAFHEILASQRRIDPDKWIATEIHIDSDEHRD